MTYRDAILGTPGLISYWRLGERAGTIAADEKALQAGAYTGGYTLDQGSLIDSDANPAVLFDGTTGYVACTNHASYQVATGSIEAWVRTTDTGTFKAIVAKQLAYAMFVDAGVLKAYDWTGAALRSSGVTVNDGKRHHCVLTFGGGTGQLYVDGVVAGASFAYTVSAQTAQLIIGYGNAVNQFISGTVDEAAVYSTTLSAATVAAHYAAGVGAPPSTLVTTTCVWREPNPPHAALFVTDLGGAKWSQRIRGMGTASILVPRSDANAANVAKLLARCVPMVTLERSDGAWPFVGFPVNPRFRASDTHGAIQLADHTILLNQANTRLIAESRKASGTFILDELREMGTRADPRLGLDLRNVGSGPAASLAMSGQNGDSLLRELEKQTGYEAYFTYAISPAGVVTYLHWQPMQGEDRRKENRWIDGEQLADVQYGFDYRVGKRSITSVGGTGAVTARNSATANTSGSRAIGATVEKVATARRAGFGGSSVEFMPQTTDVQVLAARSKQVLLAPANSAISWEFQIVESAVDPAQISVGDIRRISSDTAFFGQAANGIARIIGFSFDLGAGVVGAVAVEVE